MAKKLPPKGAVGIPFYKGDNLESATKRLIKEQGWDTTWEEVQRKTKKYKAVKAKKAVAKKTVGKIVGKAIPGVTAAIVAKDVIKGASKATCSKRGGKWVSGKCVGTTKSIFGKKHTKFKKGAQVRDPISKR